LDLGFYNSGHISLLHKFFTPEILELTKKTLC